jgi:flavin reductase (DIM6/NTAB) family NADH-FMN oxidoreductase RutF
MTASAMYVSQDPPLIAVSVSKTSATYPLIEKSKAFGINVMADSQVELAKGAGAVHGFEGDKFKELGISIESGSKSGTPLVSGCFAHIECRVRSALWDVEGNHAVYIGEVVGFSMNKELRPLVWLNNRYFRVGAECRV